MASVSGILISTTTLGETVPAFAPYLLPLQCDLSDADCSIVESLFKRSEFKLGAVPREWLLD